MPLDPFDERLYTELIVEAKQVNDPKMTAAFEQALQTLVNKVLSDPNKNNPMSGGLVKEYIPEYDITVVSSYYEIYEKTRAKDIHGNLLTKDRDIIAKSPINKFHRYRIIYPANPVPFNSLDKISPAELHNLAQDMTNRYYKYSNYIHK